MKPTTGSNHPPSYRPYDVRFSLKPTDATPEVALVEDAPTVLHTPSSLQLLAQNPQPSLVATSKSVVPVFILGKSSSSRTSRNELSTGYPIDQPTTAALSTVRHSISDLFWTSNDARYAGGRRLHGLRFIQFSLIYSCYINRRGPLEPCATISIHEPANYIRY